MAAMNVLFRTKDPRHLGHFQDCSKMGFTFYLELKSVLGTEIT